MAEAPLWVVEGLEALGIAYSAVAAGQDCEVAAGVKQQRLDLQWIPEVKLRVVVPDGHVAEDFDALELFSLGQQQHQNDDDSLHYYMI